jgi:hypothetical protein
MSSIINNKSQYTIDSHNNFFIGMDNTIFFLKINKKKITFSKKYSYNGCILVLPSTETHAIHNLICNIYFDFTTLINNTATV